MTRKQIRKKIDRINTEYDLLFKRWKRHKNKISDDERIKMTYEAIDLHNERAKLLLLKLSYD